MREWADIGHVKTERAHEHIRNLAVEVATFFKLRPYHAFTDKESEPGRWLTRVEVRENPPIRWGAIAGDAIHNLRSALDILWRRVMYPGGGGESNRAIQFPILDSADELERRYGREIKSARKRAVDLLKSSKPYKGGNEALWRLHMLDIIDKHHTLLIVGAAFTHLHIRPPPGFLGHPNPGVFSIPAAGGTFDVKYPLENGTVLLNNFPPRPGSVSFFDWFDPEKHAQFSFDVAFSEPGISEGEPILPTLHEFAHTVNGTVDAFVSAGLIKCLPILLGAHLAYLAVAGCVKYIIAG